jgi:hypothetical protein
MVLRAERVRGNIESSPPEEFRQHHLPPLGLQTVMRVTNER